MTKPSNVIAPKVWHPAPEPEPRPAWACRAADCPLAGTMSNGGKARWCFLHFGGSARAAGRITDWLMRRPIVVAALRMPDGADPEALADMGRRLAAAGLDQLAPTDAELRAPKRWRARLTSAVERMVAEP